MKKVKAYFQTQIDLRVLRRPGIKGARGDGEEEASKLNLRHRHLHLTIRFEFSGATARIHGCMYLWIRREKKNNMKQEVVRIYEKSD